MVYIIFEAIYWLLIQDKKKIYFKYDKYGDNFYQTKAWKYLSRSIFFIINQRLVLKSDEHFKNILYLLIYSKPHEKIQHT